MNERMNELAYISLTIMYDDDSMYEVCEWKSTRVATITRFPMNWFYKLSAK